MGISIHTNDFIKLTYPVVLASNSSARKRILARLNIPFYQQASSINEESLKLTFQELTPQEQAIELACSKAADVSKVQSNSLVIGADQICEIDGKIVEKPYTEERAVAQLLRLSGKTHFLHSAVSLYLKGECIWTYLETAEMTMRELSNQEAFQYVLIDQPLDACGSYYFESLGKHLFSEVKGNEDTILGLPAFPLLKTLYEKQFISWLT